jgi:hypothetical protein
VSLETFFMEWSPLRFRPGAEQSKNPTETRSMERKPINKK